MANPSKNIQVLLVICLAHTGYRRAGMALTKGENLIPLAELSDAPLAAAGCLLLFGFLSFVAQMVFFGWAAIGLVFNSRLSSMMATALAPTGALMTFLALFTGALWGKPTWGTWWVWDARLTSELVLLFLYIGFMALHGAIDDRRRADRAAGLLAIVGVVNLPIIYFSVQWWNTLHQGASVTLNKAPSMATPMLLGMLLMSLAAWAYCIAMGLARARVLLLERERHTEWARAALHPSAEAA